MKISHNWLSEFVDLNDIDANKTGEFLTLHTAELEEVLPQKPFFENVFAGKFIERREHKNSDKLSVGIFDCGDQGKKQILYGDVHAIEIGDILPIAINTTLKSGLKISESEIRGEKSEGMIADNTELGMKNEGLLRFKETDIGKPLTEICTEFADTLLDIDNKSLTHRPDLMGHRGFALEFSAIFNRNLTLPEPAVAVPTDKKALDIDVQTDKCQRFTAIKMGGITIQDSPLKTQVRLENLGVRAISNLVDVTNMIMLEFGQPMHVFDADKVEGKLIVRQAKNGEKLIALDGNEYKLSEEDMVIADEKKVLSIAGIMGGLESSVTDKTTNIIFECANFDPVSIRKSSQRLGLRSDSSMRFEKSLDPAQCKKTLFAAVEMTQTLCQNSSIESQLADYWPLPAERKTITLDPKRLRKYTGLSIDDNEIQSKLESINFEVKSSDGTFIVKVPSNRATKDIAIAEDLIEEVVRLHGFADIQSKIPKLPITPPHRNKLRENEWKMKDFIAARGFLEVYNYDFVDTDDSQFVGNHDHVTIANPLSSAYAQLRQTLVSNLIKDIDSELRLNNEVHLFEFGRTFKEVGKVLPEEVLHFALLSAKIGSHEDQSFFDLKTELQRLFKHVGLTNIQFKPVPDEKLKPYFHPSKTAEVYCNEELVGVVGILHPQFLMIKNSHIAFAECDMEKINQYLLNQNIKYQKISPYPSVYRDLSIVLNDKLPIADIEKIAKESSPYLQKIELFDEYRDTEKLGKDLKNLAFHLQFQSVDKTLEEEEIETHFQAIVDQLNKKLKAQLRLEFDKSKTS